MGFFDGIFGTPQTFEEQAKIWKRELKGEMRNVERQIRGIQREEQKALASIKEMAKKNPRATQDDFKPLAREITRSRKATDRLYMARAQLNSATMQLQYQLAQRKMAAHMGRSAELLGAMQALIKLPELNASMQKMSAEMTKAGILEEMVDDALEDMGDDISDSELDDEINGIIDDVMAAKFENLKVRKEPEITDPEVEKQSDAMLAQAESRAKVQAQAAT
eukprot:GFYU01000555.1.p1 GENE.GFYU01000555.1~~GFYU01000555.1.p1  ORF type:complete len:221 (-),score=38.13 GFYU01000555.1:202-864(-)